MSQGYGNLIQPKRHGSFSAAMLTYNQTIASYSSLFADVPVRHFMTITGAVPTLSTDGLLGPMDGTIDLGDYDPHSLEGYTWDGSDWEKRVPRIDDGSGGFLIQANFIDFFLYGDGSIIAFGDGTGVKL